MKKKKISKKKNKYTDCWCMSDNYSCHCGRPMGDRGYHSTYVYYNKTHKLCYSCSE